MSTKKLAVIVSLMAVGGSLTATEKPELTAVKPFRPSGAHADFSGALSPKVAAPGDTLTLTLTAAPEAPYHVYGYAASDESIVAKATLIAIAKKPDWEQSLPKASQKPLTKDAGFPNEPPIKYHKKPVSWTIEFKVPKDAAAAEYDLSGLVGFQTCTDRFCDQPQAIAFDAKVVVADSAEPGQTPLTFVNASSYRDVDMATRKQAAIAVPNDAVAGDQTPADSEPSTQPSNETAASVAESSSSMILYGAIGGALLIGVALIFVFRARTQHSPSS